MMPHQRSEQWLMHRKDCTCEFRANTNRGMTCDRIHDAKATTTQHNGGCDKIFRHHDTYKTVPSRSKDSNS